MNYSHILLPVIMFMDWSQLFSLHLPRNRHTMMMPALVYRCTMDECPLNIKVACVLVRGRGRTRKRLHIISHHVMRYLAITVKRDTRWWACLRMKSRLDTSLEKNRLLLSADLTGNNYVLVLCDYTSLIPHVLSHHARTRSPHLKMKRIWRADSQRQEEQPTMPNCFCMRAVK